MSLPRLIMSALICVAYLPGGLSADEPDSTEEPDLTSSECKQMDKDICASGRATFLRLLAADVDAAETPDETDVIHCFLDIGLNFSSRTISGINTLTVKSQKDGLSSITLNLSSALTITGVAVNTQPVGFTRQGSTVVITLNRSYGVGEAFTVAVSYGGRPQSQGWNSFGFTSTTAASLSQPWYAHTWWPCKDELRDKFTMDTWITVPAGKYAVSNGSLQGTDTLTGNRLRYRWHESYPIATYLVSVAVSNYTHWTQYYEHANGSMPVEFYIYPGSVSTAQTNAAHLVTAIATYSRPDVFGEYPFINEKYGIAQFDGNVNMEHQTVSSHWAFDPDIINHELAHQWWGDAVTCGTWHDIWLNEGFATYAEALYHEKKPGGSFAAYMNRMNQRRPANYSGTVYRYDASYQAGVFDNNLVYRKAAWVLHMLRHVMGDAKFFETLREYRRQYEGGFAVTEDFRRVAETVYGGDLGWFFNEWVYGPGAPTYRYGWQDVTIGGRHELRLHVRQTQTEYPLFRMPIDVTIRTAGGTRTEIIWQEFETQWYAFPVDGPVSAVTLDENSWILRPVVVAEAYISAPMLKLRWTTPLPGTAATPVMRIKTLELQFTTPVVLDGSEISVTGSRSGPRSFTYTCDASGLVRLTFDQPLSGSQTWTVRISDQVRSAHTGEPLDGELARPDAPASLPSGDGVPGGDAEFSFYVSLSGDYDFDGDVDLEDFGRLQTCLNAPGIYSEDPACFQVDLDHDADVDEFDLRIFQQCFGGPNIEPPDDCGT